MTPDVNVLVAASRSDHRHHTAARTWLEQAVAETSRGVPLQLQPMVIASFLRLVTHPKVFPDPTPMSEAVGFVEALLAVPGVAQPTLGTEWPVLRELCTGKKLAANDVPDAWLAAAVIDQGEHLVSFDADMRRLLSRSQLTRLIP